MQSTNKHIVISSYDDLKNPYYAGGGAVILDIISRELAKHYRITVLTGHFPDAKNHTKNNITYKYLGTSILGPKLGQLTYLFLLPIYAKTMTFDVWLENFTPPISTAFLPLITKKPIVGMAHMLAGEDMTRKYHLPFFLLEKISLRIYNYIIVLSKYYEEKIKKINKNVKIFTIPNGVESVPISKSKKIKEYFLFLGRIEINQKGIDLLIESYKKIKQNFRLPLIIAGGASESELKKLNKLMRNSGFQESIKYIGKISGFTKQQTISNAKALIIPSRFETFPRVALEALAQKIPLVGFDIPGLSWVPKTCMRKATAFQPESLAHELEQIVLNRSETNKMINKAFLLTKKFTVENMVKGYLSAIQTVLNENK